MSVSGRMIVNTFRTDGNQRYSWIKAQAIVVRKPDAPVHHAVQHNQLVSEHGFLGFKPTFRLEWRDQDGQGKT